MSDQTNSRPDDAPQPPPAGEGVAGERHVSEVAGRPPKLSKKAGIGVIIAGAVLACGVIVLTSNKPSIKPELGPKLAVKSEVAYVPPAPPPPEVAAAPPPLPATPPPPLPSQPMGTSTASPPPRDTKLLIYTSGAARNGQRSPGAGLMDPGLANGAAAAPGTAEGFGDGQGGATSLAVAGGSPGAAGVPQDREPGLGSRLTPTQLRGVSANVLQHQPFLLTTGTLLPCVLQTAMDSTLPGLVTCVVPQDVQGKTGLTLLDRGTKVVGEFKGGIRQGVERMFVVWTRAETPQGVVINLDSPATDPLGRSGMDGEVDRHFWQRFGGALLLSTVDGVLQAGVASASKSGTTTINTGSTEAVIGQSLAGSINLPPTVRKNQGELVSILVARDLDFSTVYGIRPTTPRYAQAVGQNGGALAK